MADKEESKEVALRDADFFDVPFNGESTALALRENVGSNMDAIDSIRSIFEEIRDGINTLVDLTMNMGPSASDLRDDKIGDADVQPTDTGPADTGGGGFEMPEMPKVGPKLGLLLMLGALTLLFEYGDVIAKAIEPVLELAKNVVDKLGVKGTLFAGLGLLAAIKLGGPLLKLLGAGAKSIKFAFGLLKDGFTLMKDAVTSMPGLMKAGYQKGKELLGGAFGLLKSGFGKMRDFIMTTVPNALKGAYEGGKKTVMSGIKLLGGAFQKMRNFITAQMIPGIAAAYGGVKGKLMGVVGKLAKAFTAMRTFMTLTLIPSITAMMAPFTPVILAVTIAVAAAVAIFSSIKAGIDEFKKSLDEGDSMLVAIIEGVTTALLTLVTLPITLIKNFVAWVAKKLGFEGIAEKLKEFNIVTFIKDGVKNLVLKAKDFILGLFNLDFKQVLGKFIDIGKSIGRVLKAIALGSIAAVKAAFPGGESPMEAFKRVYDEVSNKGNENPEMPDDKDPEAMPGVKKMDDVRKEEIAANEAEIDDLQYMNPDTVLEDGHSPDSKMFELEMRNEALYSMLSDKLDTSNEIAIKNAQIMMAALNSAPGTTIVNSPTTNQGDTITQDTHNYQDLSQNHSDKTAEALTETY